MSERVRGFLVLLVVGVPLLGCGGAASPPAQPPPGILATSPALRLVDPPVPADSLATLVRDNTNAALELLRRSGAPDASFTLSPHSLQLALAMTYEGARGTTESQMASALRWSLPKAQLHTAFNALDQQLARRTSSPQVSLRIVNALFGATSFPFQQPFVDTIATNYGAPLSRLDFAANADAARGAINDWVTQETAGEIRELLTPNDINGGTRITLVNAIHFVADWKTKFPAQATAPAAFTRLDGTPVQLPTMVVEGGFNVAGTSDWDAIEVPYEGEEISLLVVMPKREAFAGFLAGLDQAQLAQIDAALAPRGITLALPRFELRSHLPAVPVLQAMGMIDAFRSGTADLSGIGGAPGDLFISNVIHQAVVRVDEDGTRAAAASVVIGQKGGAGPDRFSVDRPFLFFIRDKASGALLFLGRFLGTT